MEAMFDRMDTWVAKNPRRNHKDLKAVSASSVECPGCHDVEYWGYHVRFG